MTNGLDSPRDVSLMPLSVHGDYIFLKICRRFCLTPVLGANVYQVGRCVEIGVPMLILFVAFSQVLLLSKIFLLFLPYGNPTQEKEGTFTLFVSHLHMLLLTSYTFFFIILILTMWL